MTSRAVELGSLSVLLLDELEDFPSEIEDEFVLITGAHAGLVSARRILRRPPRLAIFNDAGVGKDRSGVAGLELLESLRVPAAAVDVNSARIGDATDSLENGVLSHLNDLAEAIGLKIGESVRKALTRLEGQAD